MAYYLVTARPKSGQLATLLGNLRKKAYAAMRPFGKTMTCSLENALATTVTPPGRKKTTVPRPWPKNAPPLWMNSLTNSTSSQFAKEKVGSKLERFLPSSLNSRWLHQVNVRQR